MERLDAKTASFKTSNMRSCLAAQAITLQRGRYANLKHTHIDVGMEAQNVVSGDERAIQPTTHSPDIKVAAATAARTTVVQLEAELAELQAKLATKRAEAERLEMEALRYEYLSWLDERNKMRQQVGKRCAHV